MALRLEENSIVSAEICNRKKQHVEVAIHFADGSTMRAELRGNPHRDLAGRTLTLRHPSPDPKGMRPAALHLNQSGLTGDITAALKVKIPLIPIDEIGEFHAAKKEIPTTWKNAVYLEWYSASNGRVVLEASEFDLRISEPAWEMSDVEDKAAREAAAEALSEFLDGLCVIDRKKEGADASEEDDEPMNEFEWEKFLRRSDDLSNRYSEVVDKFGFEDEETIAHYMKWDHEVEPNDEGEFWLDAAEDAELGELDDEPLVRRRHPLQGQVRQLLDSVEYPQEEPDSPLASLWSAVATVSAKLAGALSSYECDPEPDAGFTIAQLKRCLTHIDTAVGEAQTASPTHVQPLLQMREAVINLQTELRKSI